jgi:hypothetical protein
MDLEYRQAKAALKEIRDCTILLNFGKDYLCEDHFLRKTGEEIESHLAKLKETVQTIKNRFPGQLKSDSQEDNLLDTIQQTAQRLQNPDEAITRRCSAGELGKELEESTKAFSKVLHRIGRRVEGETPKYTWLDALVKFLSQILAIGGAAKKPIRLLIRLVTLCVGVVIVLFLLLFFTMENEMNLQNKIDTAQEEIQAQLQVIQNKEAQRQEVAAQIEALTKGDPSREEKLAIMELNITLHKLVEEKDQATSTVGLQEKNIQTWKDQMLDMQRKPLLKRLLRM